MRVVVWETKDVPAGDWIGDVSDMYVRAWIPAGSGEGTGELQDTETHWRAKKGRGCFNYRLKFNVELPLEAPRDKLFLQVWDSDPLNPVKRGDLRGEAQISLRRLFEHAFREEYQKQRESQSKMIRQTSQ